MSQPLPPEFDPLLAFDEEHENRPEPTEPPKVPPADDVRVRLDRAERQIERALVGISAVKSDLATLVGAIEEIKRRPSRPLNDKPPTVVPLRARTFGLARTVATVLVVIALGAAMWGFASAMTYDVPQPPTIESKSTLIIAPPPMVEAEPPSAAVALRSLPIAAGNRPAPVTYVGTLTIDAEPAGDVFVNRKKVGHTPLRLDNLRAGSHLIWIERAGYRRWTRVVAVAADRISRASASLEPLSR